MGLNCKRLAISLNIIFISLFSITQASALDVLGDKDSLAIEYPSFLTRFLNHKSVYELQKEAELAEKLLDTIVAKTDSTNVVEVVEDTVSGNFTFSTLDSMYVFSLQNLNTVFDLRYNDKVRRLLEVYTNGRTVYIPRLMALSQYYFPVFEKIFLEEGLPEELKYVSVIESALNPRAGSRKGAFGLWQFMPATGRAYGLRIDDDIDERLDPVKSTIAAAKYLKSLYNIYNDWTLAIAAYNCGPGRVNSAIRRAKGKDDFWQIYNYLPRETRNYVPAFIGANYALNYYCNHDIDIDYIYNFSPDVTDTIMVYETLFFDIISNYGMVNMQTIKDYNPHFKRDFIPANENKVFTLTLPVEDLYKVKDNFDTIIFYSQQRKIVQDSIDEWNRLHNPPDITYIVKNGDTMSQIARKYGVSVSNLKAWNNKRSDLIRVKEKLIIKGKR